MSLTSGARRSVLVAVGSAVVVTFWLFSPTVDSGFLRWDDADNLIDNLQYRGLSLARLGWMWSTFHMGHYIPLTWMSFGLDFSLWGMRPGGYHLTNVLLHALNAGLFFFLARRLLSVARPGPAASLTAGALAAALFFSVHPLRTESVAWVTERRDLLSGFFLFLSLLAYLRFCAGGAFRWRFFSLAAYGASMLSKASAMLFPGLLLLLDAYPLRRLVRRADWPERLREKASFFLMAAWCAATAAMAQIGSGAAHGLAGHGLGKRLLQSLYGLGFYAWKTFFPFGLSPLYEIPGSIRWMDVLAAAASLLALTGAVWAGRRRPGLLVGLGAYVLFLLPVLGLLQSGPQWVAERYSYLSCLTWAVLFGEGVRRALDGPLGRRRAVILGGVFFLLTGLGVSTRAYLRVWSSDEALWTRVLRQDPDNARALAALGHAYNEKQRWEDGLLFLGRAMSQNPTDREVVQDVGYSLLGMGRTEEAARHYEAALRRRPGVGKWHLNLAYALGQLGRMEDSAAHYRRSLLADPDLWEAHNNLAVLLARQGDSAGALSHFRRALELEPGAEDARRNLTLLEASLAERRGT